jgi:hypothetical protein
MAVSGSTKNCHSKVSSQCLPLHWIESSMLTECSLHLNWPELHAVIHLAAIR